MKITMAGTTHQGVVRINNEDRIATQPSIGLAILADGMGGHQAGEVASQIAVDLIKQYFTDSLENAGQRPDGEGVLASIALANSAVFDLAQERPEYAGMGSTIVVSYFTGNKVYIGHVGDSRAYRLRDGTLEQITEDHSLVQELVSRGFMSREEAGISMNKNLVTRALGIEETVEADLNEQSCKNGDVYLLCSDGLNDVLPDETIQQILTDATEDLDDTTQCLIDTVNEHGGPDNVSVILIRANGLNSGNST